MRRLFCAACGIVSRFLRLRQFHMAFPLFPACFRGASVTISMACPSFPPCFRDASVTTTMYFHPLHRHRFHPLHHASIVIPSSSIASNHFASRFRRSSFAHPSLPSLSLPSLESLPSSPLPYSFNLAHRALPLPSRASRLFIASTHGVHRVLCAFTATLPPSCPSRTHCASIAFPRYSQHRSVASIFFCITLLFIAHPSLP